MRRTFVVAVGLTVLAVVVGPACRDRVLEPTGDLAPPSPQIMDGAHDAAGHPQFFFLPPLVPDPSGDPDFDAGAFDGTYEPTVEICALFGDGCSAEQPEGFPITYTMTTGLGSETIRVSEADKHYAVNWHTDAPALDPAKFYRIQVVVRGVTLGFADIDVVASGRELRNIATDQYIPLLDGRTLPIKFRIERGAVFEQGVCGQTLYYSITLTQGIGPCAGDGIAIGADYITLDGNGHLLQGPDQRTGVALAGRSGVTVSHLFVTHFANGVTVIGGSGNMLVESQVRQSAVGVSLATTLAALTRNVIANNGVGVRATTGGNRIYHNILFGNTRQIEDGGGNTWADPVNHLGNYWSNYWGRDDGSAGRLAGDFIGDTDLPHEGVDNAPLLDPSIPQRYGGQLCDDWWDTALWLVWRGGWSPVEIRITGPGGKKLSAAENDFGNNGFFAEDESVEPGSKHVQALIGTCTKRGSANGNYEFTMHALADLDYSMERLVSYKGTPLFHAVVTDVPLAGGEVRTAVTYLDQTTDSVTGEVISGTAGDAGVTMTIDMLVTTVTIGSNVPYTATITNATRDTIPQVVLQGYLVQGDVIRAGDTAVSCGRVPGELVPGTCAVNAALVAPNNSTLVPGGATALIKLKQGAAGTVLTEVTVPVTLRSP